MNGVSCLEPEFFAEIISQLRERWSDIDQRRLRLDETAQLRSQIAIASRGGIEAVRTLPHPEQLRSGRMSHDTPGQPFQASPLDSSRYLSTGTPPVKSGSLPKTLSQVNAD